MRLAQSAKKLCMERILAYNATTQRWDALPVGVSLTNSGRRSGRTEDYFNRREMLSTAPIDPKYQWVQVVGGASSYLLFGNIPEGQANIKQGGKGYLYEYSLLNIEVLQAQVVKMTPGVSASGINGTKTEIITGTYPVAMDRFASFTDANIKNTNLSKFNCYIPTYADVHPQHMLIWRGEYYVVTESVLEMNLTHLFCTKR